MTTGMHKAKRVRSVEEVQAEFARTGKSVAEWARENGVSEGLTRIVLAGKRKALRGQSHRIAVKLGIKEGVIEE